MSTLNLNLLQIYKNCFRKNYSSTEKKPDMNFLFYKTIKYFHNYILLLFKMPKKIIELASPKVSMVSQDWENRQLINTITDGICKLVNIMDNFELNCRTKLKIMTEKIEFAEKQVDYLESLFDLEKMNHNKKN